MAPDERHREKRARVPRIVAVRRASLTGAHVDVFVAQVRSLKEHHAAKRICVLETQRREFQEATSAAHQLSLVAGTSRAL